MVDLTGRTIFITGSGGVLGSTYVARMLAAGARVVATDLAEVSQDADLAQYARSNGAAVFRTWCAQCHGSGAAGAVGYPNLLDDAWLWGGDLEAIHTTIRHGIRTDEDEDARYSEMPAFADILSEEEIEQAVNHVLSISGGSADASMAEAGAVVFADNCSACHGDAGKGDVEIGAPDLTDAIWLYGGDADALRTTIARSRFGVMPAWATRLNDAEIRAVTLYVHGLGGGE